ncbi:hypothetical protein HF086_013909 [Spodoptera exigua]|uniref:Uncharacterized protein n=1 Tax=Spodoptera exigua TaxID=7107 RepID=A0A922MIF3_SPOEX|nr:hypothetical protein HF086_013909 [Spodoptera exigua]
MRRQYAEALKYCRLILQYEPHNATARGFYPLLQHKVRTQPAAGADGARHAAAGADGAHRPLAAPSFPASAGSSAHQVRISQSIMLFNILESIINSQRNRLINEEISVHHCGP